MYYGHTYSDSTNELTGYKSTLSYSAIQLWLTNKQHYREKYYLGGPSFTTCYTVFGGKVHEMVERGELTLKEHPAGQYTHEMHLAATIGNVHVQGYIDLVHEHTKSVTDIKTSKNEWTKIDLQKLWQLECYHLLLREHYSRVSSKVQVLWLETAWQAQEHISPVSFDGILLDSLGGRETLVLTGRQEVLGRRLCAHDLSRVRKLINKAAKEISEDFELWQKQKHKK